MTISFFIFLIILKTCFPLLRSPTPCFILSPVCISQKKPNATTDLSQTPVPATPACSVSLVTVEEVAVLPSKASLPPVCQPPSTPSRGRSPCTAPLFLLDHPFWLFPLAGVRGRGCKATRWFERGGWNRQDLGPVLTWVRLTSTMGSFDYLQVPAVGRMSASRAERGFSALLLPR